MRYRLLFNLQLQLHPLDAMGRGNSETWGGCVGAESCLLYRLTAIVLLVSFLCSLLESVLLSVTHAYIALLIKEGHRSGQMLKEMKKSINLPLSAILTAADEYFEASGRRLTFEYVLLGGINDRREDALELAGLLRGRPALLNLIPYNPVAGLPYQTPTAEAVDTFSGLLSQRGINIQIRRRKGSRIDAACGQLRRTKAGAAE